MLPSTAPVVLRIELRRRADLNRLAILPSDPNQVAEAADNPWVAVDYMDVPVSVMALKTHRQSPTDYSRPDSRISSAAIYNTPPPPTRRRAARITIFVQPLRAVPARTSAPSGRSRCTTTYGLNPFNPTTTNATTPNGPFVATSADRYTAKRRRAHARRRRLWQGNSLGQDNDAAGYNPGTIPPRLRDRHRAASALPAALRSGLHFDRRAVQIPLYGQLRRRSGRQALCVGRRSFLLRDGLRRRRADIRLHDGGHQRRHCTPPWPTRRGTVSDGRSLDRQSSSPDVYGLTM